MLYSNVRANKATTLQTIPLFSPLLPSVCFYLGDLQSQIVSVLASWSSVCDSPVWLSFLLCPWFSSVPGHPPRGRGVDVSAQKQAPAPSLCAGRMRGHTFSCRSLLVGLHPAASTASRPCSSVEPQPSASSKRKYFLKSERSRSGRLLSRVNIKGACMGLETYPPLELAMQTVVSIEQLYLLGFGRLQSTDCYDFAVHTFKYKKKRVLTK